MEGEIENIEYTIYIRIRIRIYIYVMYQEVPSHTEAIYNCQGPVGPDPAALVFAASFCWPAPPLIFFSPSLPLFSSSSSSSFFLISITLSFHPHLHLQHLQHLHHHYLYPYTIIHGGSLSLNPPPPPTRLVACSFTPLPAPGHASLTRV